MKHDLYVRKRESSRFTRSSLSAITPNETWDASDTKAQDVGYPPPIVYLLFDLKKTYRDHIYVYPIAIPKKQQKHLKGERERKDKTKSNASIIQDEMGLKKS